MANQQDAINNPAFAVDSEEEDPSINEEESMNVSATQASESESDNEVTSVGMARRSPTSGLPSPVRRPPPRRMTARMSIPQVRRDMPNPPPRAPAWPQREPVRYPIIDERPPVYGNRAPDVPMSYRHGPNSEYWRMPPSYPFVGGASRAVYGYPPPPLTPLGMTSEEADVILGIAHGLRDTRARMREQERYMAETSTAMDRVMGSTSAYMAATHQVASTIETMRWAMIVMGAVVMALVFRHWL